MLKRGWKELEFWKQNIAGSFLDVITKDFVSSSLAFFPCVFSKMQVNDGWHGKIRQV